jgi:hypothetical protein
VVLASIAAAAAAADPDRAERIAQAIPDEDAKARALAGIAAAVAGTDPDRAERIAPAVPDEDAKARALAGIAAAVAGSLIRDNGPLPLITTSRKSSCN